MNIEWDEVCISKCCIFLYLKFILLFFLHVLLKFGLRAFYGYIVYRTLSQLDIFLKDLPGPCLVQARIFKWPACPFLWTQLNVIYLIKTNMIFFKQHMSKLLAKQAQQSKGYNTIGKIWKKELETKIYLTEVLSDKLS